MNRISKALAIVALLGGFTSAPALAKTDGILIVGTQTEVREILNGTTLYPTFSEESPNALVAVRLSHGKMSIYEGGAVQDIVKAIVKLGGKIVHGGVVFTVKVGSALWDLLEDTACFVVHVGEAALKAACWVLSHAKCLILNGVKFVAHTAVDILKAIAELLHCIFHCP